MDICTCRFDWTFQEYIDASDMPFYVEDTEEGWGVFRWSDHKPVSGPARSREVIQKVCDAKNRRALALRPQDV